MRLEGEELLGAPEAKLNRVRGESRDDFQEPMSALDPLYSLESQIAAPLIAHAGATRSEARARAADLLDQVGIADARARLNAYPHELSGGERQRAMIAMAIANRPSLLVADEPTTALDVTVQAQILDLLAELQRSLGMAMVVYQPRLAARSADRRAGLCHARGVDRRGGTHGGRACAAAQRLYARSRRGRAFGDETRAAGGARRC